MSITTGMKGTATKIVTENDTAKVVKSGSLPVLATPVISAEATVTVVKGKKITLHCLAYDEGGEIGEAEHIRFVVEAKPFMEKAGTR